MIDNAEAEASLSSTERRFQQLGTSLSNAGQRMQKVGRTLTTRVTAPLALVGAGILKVGMDFDKQMSKVQAISGATGKDFTRLRDTAQELGRTTSFSASQAAEGMEYLALAGWKTNDIIAGMPGLLNLAAAGALELGTAADIVSDVMSAYGMSSDKATHAADVFAYAQANANTNVEQMGEAMKYLAPVANSFGWGIEESAAAVMKLADSGLKGGIAGQAFASSLSRLSKATPKMEKVMKNLNLEFFDSNEQLKPLPELMKELEKGTSGLTDKQKANALATIFGTEAYKHWAILIEAGSDQLGNLTTSLENADGTAQNMAETMMDNFAGAVIQLKSALEGLAIQFSDVMTGSVRKFAEFLTEMVRKFSGLDESVKRFIVIIGVLAAAIGPVILVLGLMVSSLGAIATALGTFAAPIAIAVAAIAGITLAATKLYKNLKKETIPEIDRFGSKVSKSTKEALNGFFELSDGASLKLREMSLTGKKVSGETKEYLVNTYSQMNDQILKNLDERHASEMEKMRSFLLNSSTLTAEEEEKALDTAQRRHEAEVRSLERKEARAKEIIERAAKERRSLTEVEQTELQVIREQMNESAVKALSKNEVESKIIMERMKQSAGDVSALQAAEVVRNSNKQKTGAVKEAEKQYDESIAQIVKMRDEMGIISSEQADQMIREATKQRDETVLRAEETHQQVVEAAQAQATEHIDKVNWETGEILTAWDVFKTRLSEYWQTLNEVYNLDEVFGGMKEAVSNALEGVITVFQEKTAVIQEFWAENGPQILEAFSNIWTAFLAVVEFVMPAVLLIVQTVLDAVGNIFSGALDIILGLVQVFAGIFTGDWRMVWEGIKQILSGALQIILGFLQLSLVGQAIALIKNFVTYGLNLFKSLGSLAMGIFANWIANVLSYFSNLKAKGMGIWQGLKSGVVSVIQNLVSSGTSKFSELLTKATNIFNDLKSAITNPVEKARDLVSDAVDKIKGFFSGMDLKIPSISVPKLPKFTLSGSFGWKPPSVPKIGIKWNAKGALFKRPTVMDMGPYGMQGFGEAGPEVGLPLTSHILGQIGQGIARTMDVVNPLQSEARQPVQINLVLNKRVLLSEIIDDIDVLLERKARG